MAMVTICHSNIMAIGRTNITAFRTTIPRTATGIPPMAFHLAMFTPTLAMELLCSTPVVNTASATA